MKLYFKVLLPAAMLLSSVGSMSALDLTKTTGWHEALAAQWRSVGGAVRYEVAYRQAGGDEVTVDDELIRLYPDGWRVDVPGLKAGSYTVIVKAFDSDGTLIDSAESDPVAVDSFIREGFAFSGGEIPGAYNADGTPKEGARVLYITPENVNTVKMAVVTDGKGKETEGVGLTGILKNYNKGYEKRPLIIRMIGCISGVDGLKGGTAVEFTGANFGTRATRDVTVEGIGNDATAYGFGFYAKRCKGLEIRNLGIMLFPNDGISVENDNRNLWFHHCDFFYGQPGKDADQSKGDGTIDMKYNSSDITVDFNHFFDSGKCTFAGGATESGPIYFTYHHNWFDHADSRCPRLCHSSVHIYNNYFDANATMCLLSTENTSAFVEANYYRNCPSPMEINMQGTNKKRWPDGTQNGGMNKGWNNLYEGKYELITQHDNATDFDVYVVDSPDEQIPATVKSLKGGNTYDNFDTSATMYQYTPDAPADVPAIVMASAGRMEGGDFKWTFDNKVDDTHTSVNTALKAALTGYRSSLVSVGGTVPPGYSGATAIASESARDSVEIYTIGGVKLDATSTEGLPAGIYIIRQGERVEKAVVR